jgi:hypothetical protein
LMRILNKHFVNQKTTILAREARNHVAEEIKNIRSDAQHQQHAYR